MINTTLYSQNVIQPILEQEKHSIYCVKYDIKYNDIQKVQIYIYYCLLSTVELTIMVTTAGETDNKALSRSLIPLLCS